VSAKISAECSVAGEENEESAIVTKGTEGKRKEV